jgi:hypothetical protein
MAKGRASIRRLVLEIADRFNKFPHEVAELSMEEFNYCLAFMNVKADEEKRAYEKAEAKAKHASRARKR